MPLYPVRVWCPSPPRGVGLKSIGPAHNFLWRAGLVGSHRPPILQHFIRFNAEASTPFLLVSLSFDEELEPTLIDSPRTGVPLVWEDLYSTFLATEESSDESQSDDADIVWADSEGPERTEGWWWEDADPELPPRALEFYTRPDESEAESHTSSEDGATSDPEDSEPIGGRGWLGMSVRMRTTKFWLDVTKSIHAKTYVYFWGGVGGAGAFDEGGLSEVGLRGVAIPATSVLGWYFGWYSFWSQMGIFTVNARGLGGLGATYNSTVFDRALRYGAMGVGLLSGSATSLPLGDDKLPGDPRPSLKAERGVEGLGECDIVAPRLFRAYTHLFNEYFRGAYAARTGGVYNAFMELISPYSHAWVSRSSWVEDLGVDTAWMCFLTFHFKRRSLYVGLQQSGAGCVFSYSSGMFLPNYRQYWLPRKLQKLQLKYRRSLGHKDRKEYNKKKQVLSWKCKRFSYSTKIFLVNYIRLWLLWAHPMQLCLILHGVAHGWHVLLSEAFTGGNEVEQARILRHNIICLCVYGGFRCTASKRAINRRLTKQMWSATKPSSVVD